MRLWLWDPRVTVVLLTRNGYRYPVQAMAPKSLMQLKNSIMLNRSNTTMVSKPCINVMTFKGQN